MFSTMKVIPKCNGDIFASLAMTNFLNLLSNLYVITVTHSV